MDARSSDINRIGSIGPGGLWVASKTGIGRLGRDSAGQLARRSSDSSLQSRRARCLCSIPRCTLVVRAPLAAHPSIRITQRGIHLHFAGD